MAKQSIDNFKNPADLPSVVFMAGEEDYLLEQHTKHLLAIGVPQDARDFNLDVLYCPDNGARRIIEIARSFPMMAERRMVIVKDINKLPAADLKALAQYANQPNPGTCLVLLSRSGDLKQKALKDLKTKAFFVECKKVYENQAISWVEKTLLSKSHKIRREAISLLVMQVGTNLRDLMNEIDKLLLYVEKEREITTDDVAAVAGFRKEYTIFALQNALGERNLKLALEIYERIRQGVPAQVILFQLSKYFSNLIIALGFSTGQNDSELAKLTQTHPFFVKDLHRNKRRFSGRELENALENLRMVDYILKTFPVNESLMIQQLIIHVVRGIGTKQLPFASKIM